MGGGSSKDQKLNNSVNRQKSDGSSTYQSISPAQKSQKKTSQLKQALTLLQKQQFQQALDLLNKINNDSLQFAEAQYLKGLAYLGLNDLKHAQLHCEEAIKINSKHSNALAEIGNIMILQGKYVEASETFTKLLEINEKSFEAHFGLAFINSVLNNHQISQEYYEKALGLKKNDKNALINYGHLLFKLKNYDAAQEKYGEALKKDPIHLDAIISYCKVLQLKKQFQDILDFCKTYEDTNIPKIKIVILNIKSQALLGLKQYEQSKQLCEEILKFDPQNQDALFSLGRNYYGLNEIANSLNCFNSILEENPQHMLSLKAMVKIFYEVHNEQQLIKCCDKILLFDQTDMSVYLQRANALMKRKEFSKALDDYNFILKQDVKNLQAQKNRCQCLIELKEFEMAAACCDQMLKLVVGKSDKAEMLYLKGQCHLGAQQLFSAKTSMEQAIQLEPKNEELILKIANAYRDTGNFQPALTYFDKLLKLKPKTAIYSAEKAQLLLKQNNLKEALKLLNTAIQLEPNNASFLMQRAKIYTQNQALDDAIGDMTRASQLSINDSEVFFELGSLHHMQSNFEKAIPNFKKSIMLFDCNERYYVKLALTLSMNDEDEEAIQLLRNTLQTHPDYDDCQHLLETLVKKPQHIRQYTNMFVFVVTSLLQVGMIDDKHPTQDVLAQTHQLIESKLKTQISQNPQIFEIIRVMISKKFDYIIVNNQKEIKKVLTNLYKSKFKNDEELIDEIIEVGKKVARLKEAQLKQVILTDEQLDKFLELCGNMEQFNNPVAAVALQDALAVLTILILTSNKLAQGQHTLKNQVYEIVKNGSLTKLKQKK